MKRVAIIAHGLSDGGAERVASMLANYYDSIGHKVLYIAIYSDKKEYPLNKDIDYKFINAGEKKGLIALIYRSLEIKRSVSTFHADVAVSFIEHELLPLVLSHIPVIPSLRNDPKSTERGMFLKQIRNFNYAHSYKVIFQTQGAKMYFNPKIQKKGVIIRNPLKDNLPYWNEEQHKKVFMTACRINTQKNIPMLIKAFEQFHKEFPEYILEIYGKGPESYLKELEQLCCELEIQDNVFFKGHSTEIHKKMTESEAFLLTSNYEGLSNAMLEAMAIGVPCICTDCPPGGAREMIEPKNAGILIPIGDVTALAQAMKQVAKSSEYRKQLSSREKYIREELAKDKIYDQWSDVLRIKY